MQMYNRTKISSNLKHLEMSSMFDDEFLRVWVTNAGLM